MKSQPSYVYILIIKKIHIVLHDESYDTVALNYMTFEITSSTTEHTVLSQS